MGRSGVKDEKVSIGCTVAYGMWAVATALFAIVVITEDVKILAVAFLAMGIAATATVRTYFVEFSNMIRKAFELDRESVTTLPRSR
jgi:glucan phosphoethanolaminetransferase (alkaline phosphatase superfamily)